MRLFIRAVSVLFMIGMCIPTVMLAIFIAGIALPGKFDEVMHKSPNDFQDFIKYYACGKIALSGERALAYDPRLQQDTLTAIVGPYNHGSLPAQYKFQSDYPPPVYVLMAPLAALPLQAAIMLFLALSIASTGTAVFVSNQGNLKLWALWMVAITACVFSWRTLAMGQMTWLVLGLIVFFFRCLLDRRPGHDLLGGVCLALAGLKLQYVLFLLVPVIVLRRWKLLGTTIALLLVLAAITVVWMGPAVILQYPQIVGRIESSDPYIGSMTCIRSLAGMILPPAAVPMATAFSLLLGLAITAVTWRRVRLADERQQRWAAALTLCLALIFSPHTHSYDSLLLAAAALLTLPGSAAPASRRPAMRVWSLVLLAFPIASWLIFKLPADLLNVQVLIFMSIYTLLTVSAAGNLQQEQQGAPA